MADYFTEFSFAIRDLTDAERAWLTPVLAFLRNDAGDPDVPLPDADLADVFQGEDREDWYPGFDAEIDTDSRSWPAAPESSYMLWVHSNESGDIDKTAMFCRLFLRRHRPDDFIAFEWSGTCTKPRLDAFGGGAVFVTAEKCEWHNGGDWISQKVAAHEAAR